MATLEDVRKEFPELADLSDQDAVDVIHANLYPDLPKDQVAQALGVKMPEPAKPKAGFMRRALDMTAIPLAQGIIGVPEAMVGMADLATNGQAGKLAEAAGIKFKEARDILQSLKSDDQQQAEQAVSSADGFVPTLVAAAQNPSAIVSNAVESAPSFIPGGAVARGSMRLAARLGPTIAGAIGEGAVAAGQNAEQVRQEDPNGTLTPQQSAILAASGALTAGIGGAAGRVANKLGITKIETAIAKGSMGPAEAAVDAGKEGLLRKIAAGAGVEGLLQELPQSYQEQVAQNLAQGKPWDEGAANAGVMGALAGGLMGGAAAPFEGHEQAPVQAPEPTPGDTLRAEMLPETGPMSRALNAAVEAAAQKADAGHPIPEEPALNPALNPASLTPAPAAAPVVDPALQAAAIAQREADRPPEPTGEILPGDIVTQAGGPFTTMLAASRTLQRQGPGWELVPVTGGLVVRKVAPNGPIDAAAQPGPADAGAVPGDPGLGAQPPVAAADQGDAVAPVAGPAPGADAAGVRPGPAAVPTAELNSPATPEPVAAAPAQAPITQPQGATTPAAAAPSVEPKVDTPKPAPQPSPPEGASKPPASGIEATPNIPGVEPAPRTVNVAGQQHTLTPEQASAWDQLDASYKSKFDAAKSRFERSVNQAPLGNPDMGLRSAQEQYDVDRKTLGMQLSAERRRIVGALTPKEQQAQAQQDARVRVGDTVQTPAGTGQVTGMAYGKVRVKIGDKSQAFGRDTVKKVAADTMAVAEPSSNTSEGESVPSSGTIRQTVPDDFPQGSSTPDAAPSGAVRDGQGSGEGNRQGNGQGNSLTEQTQPSPGPQPSAPAAAPARKVPKQVREAHAAREKKRADYFTPGNVVQGYNGLDRVLAYQPASEEGQQWRVQVQRVVKRGDEFVPAPNERPRWHQNEPEAKNMAAGPVLRAPAEQTRASEPELSSNAESRSETGSTVAGQQPTFAAKPDESSSQDGPNARGQSEESVAPAADSSLPTAPAPSSTSVKIEDFGEKLAGARKDYAATLKDAADVDVRTEPLSKSWPEPDYDKLLASGVAPDIVAFVRAARDEVPTKPQTAWKLKGWVEKVQALRGFALRLLSGEVSADRLRDTLDRPEFAQLREEVGGRAELYQAVGHEASLKGVRLQSAQYSMYKGQSFNPPKRMWAVVERSSSHSWPNELAIGDTKQQAIDAFKARMTQGQGAGEAVPGRSAKTPQFSIYRKRGTEGTFIGKKIGREYVDLKKLPDVAQARKFLAEHPEELEAALARYRQTPYERNTENAPRVGEDHRLGAPVTPEVFAQTFGFRGVQFGNYVEQDRRQSDLNQAYDGLMDLAAVLGVPPRALSLNGRLGLAFGARGKGGKNAPAAHYETGNIVINLTKGGGPGSLAHEWWHSLDNYFGRQAGTGGYITGGTTKGDQLRPAMQAAFDAVRRASQVQTLRQRSAALDKRKAKPYWNTPEELSARAFESYVIAKLKDHGAANDYLANVVDQEAWDRSERLAGHEEPTYPYPTADEIPGLRAAFDEFFQAVETKEDEAGNLALHEPTASEYGHAYETDLFGQPLRAQPGESRPARPQPAGLPRDAQPVSTVPGDTPAPAGNYQVRTTVGVTQRRVLGAPIVRTAAQAASAMQHLYRSAVERFDGIVTDKDGKPLAVVGGFKGSLSQASVYAPTIVGEAIRVPGAANIWFAHNHPSGTPQLSRADVTLNQALTEVFEGSGIEPRGLLAIGHGEFGFVEPHESVADSPAKVPALNSSLSVPVIERELAENGLPDRPKIEAPVQAIAAAAAYYKAAGAPGLLLLNAQHQVAAWVPLPAVTMGKLSHTGGLAAIYRAVSEANAGTAIIVHGGELAKAVRPDGGGDTIAQNIGAALGKAGVSVLDIIDAKSGTSAAEQGQRMVSPAMFSRTLGEQSPALEALSEADDLFALPRLQGKTVSEIAFDLDPAIKVRRVMAGPGQTERWRVTLPNEGHADISIRPQNRYGPTLYGFDMKGGEMVDPVLERPGENPDAVPQTTQDVILDASALKPGQGGNQVYAIAGALAHNTGRIFIGDPAGLSKIALRRRSEQMLSLALRYGTTDFLAPHPDQIRGDAKIGVPPLKWSYGDDESNVANLIALNVKAVENAFPEVAKVRFDVADGTFRSIGTGQPVARSRLLGRVEELRRRDHPDLTGAGAGSRTVARALVLRSIMEASDREGEGSGSGRGILAAVGRILGAQGPAQEALSGIFSRRDGRDRKDGVAGRGRAPGIDLQSAQELAAHLVADGLVRLNVVQSVADMPLRERGKVLASAPDGRVRGVYIRQGDSIWLVADHIKGADEFTEVALHEAFHRGLANLIPNAKPLLHQMWHSNQSLRKATAEQMRLHGIGKTEAIEEALAVMAQEGEVRNLSGWAKLVDAIRAWLAKMSKAAGLSIDWTDDKVRDFVAGMTREGLKAGVHVNAGSAPALSRPGGTGIITVKQIGAKWATVRDEGTGNEQHIGYHDTESAAQDAAERARVEVTRGAGRTGAPWWVANSTEFIQSTGSGRLDSLDRQRAVAATLKARARAVSTEAEGIALNQHPERAGYCFSLAAQASASGVGNMVIGWTPMVGGGGGWHAVVMRAGMVYDPTFGRWFKPGIYERLGFDPHLTLTTEQVRDYLASTGGMAPDARNQGLGDDPTRLSRATTIDDARQASTSQRIVDKFDDLIRSHKSFNWWHRTVGTQFHKAKANEAFRAVYDKAQEYLHDTAAFANDPAGLAPQVLPQLKGLGDVRRPLTLAEADRKALTQAVNEGTLNFTRDDSGRVVPAGEGDTAGVVFTPEELRTRYGFTPKQVELYQQFRAATDRSLDILAASDVARFLGGDLPQPLKAMISAGDTGRFKGLVLAMTQDAKEKAQAALGAARQAKRSEMSAYWKKQKAEMEGPRGRAGARLALLEELDAEKARLLSRLDTAVQSAEAEAARATAVDRDVRSRYQRIDDLKAQGYAPLMRFGRYTLDVTKDGTRHFFSMYETERAANAAARQFRESPEFKGATVSQGILSEEAYKLFSGMTPETLELFAQATGAEKSEIFQDYLRRAKNNRSAMKRLIKRSGVAGFSEDPTRVLAAFLTSNARAASAGLHTGDLASAVEAIPKEAGDVKDEAARLQQYVQNPQEEAQAVRGLLFAQFLGGSVASAMVNLTQPVMMTLPYLSQFGGTVAAGRRLAAAGRLALGKVDPASALGQALALADKEGITQPQELHQLQSEVSRTFGSNAAVRRASFIWGSLFALSESFNRRLSFIAAYNTAVEQKMADPFKFAKNAVEETQGVYNKANRPNWARGAPGATLFTFKQFSISYLEFLSRLPTKERTLALAILVLAAGTQGLPFADDLDDLIDTLAQQLGYDLQSKLWKTQVLNDAIGPEAADFVLHGVSALPGMPLDVSQRLGTSNLIPGTGLLLKSKTDKAGEITEALGPAASSVMSLVKGLPALFSGDIGQFFAQAGPTATKNIQKAVDMASTGQYRDALGRKVTDVTPGDALVKAIGFQPAEVARDSRSAQMAQQQIALAKQVQAEITAKWAQGLMENDPAMVQAARRQLAQWNLDNPASRIMVNTPAVVQRVRQMRMTRDERITKAAPKGMRAETAQLVAE